MPRKAVANSIAAVTRTRTVTESVQAVQSEEGGRLDCPTAMQPPVVALRVQWAYARRLHSSARVPSDLH